MDVSDLLRSILILQVTLNAFVTANGCDGVAGGDGGVIHAPVDNGKTLVVPGNGHGLSKGKKGTLLCKYQ